MHSIVVYESMFGNTEETAKSIARGLAAHMSVDLIEVAPVDEGGRRQASRSRRRVLGDRDP